MPPHNSSPKTKIYKAWSFNPSSVSYKNVSFQFARVQNFVLFTAAQKMTYFLIILFYWRPCLADISHLTNKFSKLLGGGGGGGGTVATLEPPLYIYDDHHFGQNHHYYVPEVTNRPPSPPPSPPTTEFTLPEIIINRSVQPDGRHYYAPPSVAYDDISATYLPPNVASTYLPPSDVVHPQSDEVPNNDEMDAGGYIITPPSQTYLPVRQPAGRQLKTGAKSTPLRLQLNEMKCLANSINGYFKVVLSVQSFLSTAPVIDEDVAAANDCNIQLVQSRIVIDINGASFSRCAIRSCDENGKAKLCLKLRFPLIKGMTTLGDSLLTLQCLVQVPIISKTHALHLGVSRDKYDAGHADFRAQF